MASDTPGQAGTFKKALRVARIAGGGRMFIAGDGAKVYAFIQRTTRAIGGLQAGCFG